MRQLILIIHCSGKPEGLSRILKDVSAFTADRPNAKILIISDRRIDRHHSLFTASSTGLIGLIENSEPQGSGGNQKIGFLYAIQNGFERVFVLHTTFQADSGMLLHLWKCGETMPAADGILGMAPRRTDLSCLWQWPLEKMVSVIANRLTGTCLRGWHADLRAYKTSALQSIAYELNANTSVFETEVLLQLIKQGGTISDLSLPRIRSSNRKQGLPQALEIIKACAKYRLQKYNLFYDFRYHPQGLLVGLQAPDPYESKLDFNSPHAFVCRDPSAIPAGSKVLDIGSSSGYVARALSEDKRCHVTAIDRLLPSRVRAEGFTYLQFDLELDADRLCEFIGKQDFDVILLLDVLEHLAMPEAFLLKLYRIPYKKKPRFIFSTGNVSFFVVRLMLLFGYFNYGEKGILDITHKRLFSWRTFQNLFDQTGFVILRKCSFPAPYRFLGFGPVFSRWCEHLNNAFIRLRPSLFAYQILLIATPFDTVENRLHPCEKESLQPNPEKIAE